MDDSIEIVKQVLKWKSAGQGVALASVVKTWGSAPRRMGSMMCIDSNMKFEGSVSGGCVETAVIEQAVNTINTQQSTLLEFGVTNQQAWEIGLACGGNIEIFVKPVLDQELGELSKLFELNTENTPALLLSQLKPEGRFEVISVDEIDDYKILAGSNKERAENSLRQDRPQMIEIGESRYFIQPFNADLNVYIVGAVHISQQLVPMIEQLGFTIHVIDPRATFANQQRFPNVNVITKWPAVFFNESTLNHRSAVITLTHDPKFDDPALHAALNSDAFYIGALGSRKTHAGRIERLQQAGFSEQRLARIHAPIGLDIKAANPTEIALSIASELVRELRKSD